MNLNIISILYISFRLAPFILVSYLSLSSLFGGDYKAIVYLAGLLIACFFTSMTSNGLPAFILQTTEKEDDILPDVCNSITLTGVSPFSKLPLSQTVFAFTYAYLLYVIYVHNIVNMNLPTIIIFPFLMLADLMWHYTYKCSSILSSLISISIGLVCGLCWGAIIDSSNATNLQYLNGISGQNTCSRPQSQKFKCSNINVNGEIKNHYYDTGNINTSIVSSSIKLYSSIYNFTASYSNESRTISIPYSGVYIIIIDSNEEIDGQRNIGDATKLFYFMVSGIKGDSASTTTNSSNMITSSTSNLSITDTKNGQITLSSNTGGTFDNCQIYYYTLYSKSDRIDLNQTKSLSIDSPQSFQMPSSGFFFITVDGNGLTNAENIYSFYAVCCINDDKNVSFICQDCNYLTGNKGADKKNTISSSSDSVFSLTVSGNKNGQFSLQLQNGKSSQNNLTYHIYYNQLCGGDTSMVLLNKYNMPININIGVGSKDGSKHTLTLPTSGVFLITVDGNNFNNVNAICSFYICGFTKGSSNISVITTITSQTGGLYIVKGLSNAQFSLEYKATKGNESNVFNVYYQKIYP